jgi:uncharacterized protein
MKRLLLLITLLSIGFSVHTHQKSKKGVAQLAVAGSATLEVDPDTFHLQLHIREYFLEELDLSITDANLFTTLGPSIIDLEDRLLEQLTTLGIQRSDIRLTNASTQVVWLNRSNNNTRSREQVRTRNYQVIVSSMQLVDKIQSLSLSFGGSASLSDMKHSQMEDLKLQVKRMALDNARLRADNLAAGYGKVVGLVFVSEDDSRIITQQGDTGMIGLGKASRGRSNSDSMMLSASMDDNLVAERESVAARKITLTASVDAVFALR